jgi:hypothetical protein
MTSLTKLLQKATSEDLKSINSSESLQKVADSYGVEVCSKDVHSFLLSQQSNNANKNMAVDGGSVVFGRDWYYPGPSIDPKNLVK